MVEMPADFTLDVYTPLEHMATNPQGEKTNRFTVGLTTGLAAVDADATHKLERERHFPIDLLDRLVRYSCADGNASAEYDKRRVVAEIGADRSYLDNTVRSFFAASALRRVLDLGGERRERYMHAIMAALGLPRCLGVGNAGAAFVVATSA